MKSKMDPAALINCSFLLKKEKLLKLQLAKIRQSKQMYANAINVSSRHIIKLENAHTMRAAKLVGINLISNQLGPRITRLKHFLDILQTMNSSQEVGWGELERELLFGVQSKRASEHHSEAQIYKLRLLRSKIARVNENQSNTRTENHLHAKVKQYSKSNDEVERHKKALDEAISSLWKKKRESLKSMFLGDSEKM